MDQTVDVTIPVKPEVAAAFADARVEIDGLTDAAATGVVVPAAVGPARYSFWSASTVLNGDFESITGYFGFLFYQQSKPGGAAPQGGGVSRGGASGRNHAVEQFTARLEVVPFSLRAAAHFGQIRAELAKLGTLCGACDMLIGAHARSEGLMLVTNNVGEFQRIPGLLVDNWV
jgi:hypothetical protein